MTITTSHHDESDTAIYQNYRFMRYEEVEERWLQPDQPLPANALCWAMRGRRSKVKNPDAVHGEERQRKALFNRAWVVANENNDDEEDDTNKNNDSNNKNNQQVLTNSDKENRVLVRYPLGSTYRVRRVNLLPVLQETRLVIVLTQTEVYRRWAVVHTQPNDAFCEIGCDVGLLVHRVATHSDLPGQIIGLDTCRASIEQAKQRFPDYQQNFHQWRVPLTGQWRDEDEQTKGQGTADTTQQQSTQRQQRRLPKDLFPTQFTGDYNENLVVAIDINGNRELSMVQECIQIVIQEWKPRLVVVKSETLHEALGKE